MKNPTEPKRFPAWLRGIGWLAFGLLGVATLLIVARWLVIYSGHQEVARIVSARRKSAGTHARTVPGTPADPAAASAKPAAAHGMTLASLPYFGNALTGDIAGWNDFYFSEKIDGIATFLRPHAPTFRHVIVGGSLSFRAILHNMGTDVPETMTEAEAAAEYLKRADQFSGLLAQWREAVAKGPMDPGGPADYESNPGVYRFASMSGIFEDLLRMTAEAQLRTGDAAGAWADWQTLKNSADRESELFPADRGGVNIGYDRSEMLRLAWVGLQSGIWTDDQLSEFASMVAQKNALASALQNQEREKAELADYYNHFQEHEKQITRDILETNSQVNKMVNQLTLTLTTDQQIRDNVELMQAHVDQRLSFFDPETGFYMRPTEEEIAAYKEAQQSSGSPYFIYANAKNGDGDPDQYYARSVIQEQSTYDQFRLAAALQTYQHRTGSYPDHLEAVSGQFPNGAPLDIATGQPYFYQRDADGGYTLWGTGIDGKNDGGNEKTDVTWKHRPTKSK